MRHRTATLALLLGAALGCGADPAGPRPLPAPELRAAPLTVTLAGATLALETSLWRDFQPSSPPDGKPLIAVMRVRTAGGSPMPPAVRADAAWVVYGDRVWSAAVAEEYPREASSFEVVAREGPKWGPGVTVDVVVRLRDAGGATALLRATAQPIHRTD